jgi:LacI family transcriptional regulator
LPSFCRWNRHTPFNSDHACEGLTVKDLARVVHVSQQMLATRFKDVVGRSPGEGIRRVRMERAKHYLVTTHLTIANIAGLCGYSEQSKFTNFFKRETGVSPSEFRKKPPA